MGKVSLHKRDIKLIDRDSLLGDVNLLRETPSIQTVVIYREIHAYQWGKSLFIKGTYNL